MDHTPTIFCAFTDAFSGKADPVLYGGKGAGLLEMSNGGLPVPEAMVITTQSWATYRETGELPDNLVKAMKDFVGSYPASMFSVRSGAPISMPGMMDTLLNVGVGPDEDLIYPGCYRRFLTGWLTVVKGQHKDRVKRLIQMTTDRAQGDAGRFRHLTQTVLSKAAGDVDIPGDRLEQIKSCVKAVFDSWDTPRARAYRQMHDIPENLGTGCVIQRMVMGTAEGLSGSGVMFSRNPATGENVLTGEIAWNAQGEEVVSGEVTPINLQELYKKWVPAGHNELYTQLCLLAENLEGHFGDVQDIEFTVENNVLYVLQTRTAKMSARARIVTACALAKELHPGLPGLQTKFIKARVDKGLVARTLVPTVATDITPYLTGLPASPGAVIGKVVFRTTPLHKIDKGCILVAEDTSPDDFPAMSRAGAILTATGGFTCHAAVVARGIGVPAVVGCEKLSMADSPDLCTFELPDGDLVGVNEGDTLTLDGASGGVWLGEKPVQAGGAPRELYEILNEIVKTTEGVPFQTVHYIDCGIGQNVALPILPGDALQIERQIARAGRLTEAGKNVGFILEVPGFGEDLIVNDIRQVYSGLKDHYGPDLSDYRLIKASGGTDAVANLLGMATHSDKVVLLDLLDLLD